MRQSRGGRGSGGGGAPASPAACAAARGLRVKMDVAVIAVRHTRRPSLNACSCASEPGSGALGALVPFTQSCCSSASAPSRAAGSASSSERTSACAPADTCAHRSGKSPKPHSARSTRASISSSVSAPVGLKTK